LLLLFIIWSVIYYTGGCEKDFQSIFKKNAQEHIVDIHCKYANVNVYQMEAVVSFANAKAFKKYLIIDYQFETCNL